MTRQRVRATDSSKRIEFEKLEDRNLLSGSGLIHVDVDHDSAIPVITSGDPNGTPPVTPADLIDPNVPTSPFAGVVALNPNGTNVCTGTVIAPTIVLTAGHCVDFNNDGVADVSLAATEVHFNHQEDEIVHVGVANIIAHPEYTGFANPTVNDDIAIIELTQPIPDGVPIYDFNTTEWTDPEVIYLTGYGTSGDAINGYSIGAGHDDKRVGQNLASGFELDDEGNGRREIFLHDNDGPDLTTDFLGDGGTLGNDIEVQVGGGDSGGPSFVWDDANGDTIMTSDELTLFGVNTFTGGGGLAGAPFYGSQGGGMNVEAYADWIGQFVSRGEVQVTQNFNEILDGGVFDFGTTALGQSITKTFTVTNTDDSGDLMLVEPISVPGEYTVTSSFGQTTLAPFESTTFDVRFDANPLGNYTGQIAFNTSDTLFNFQVTATVASPIGEAGTVTVDGGWTTVFLRNTYIEPVVVAGPASFNDPDPVSVRVRNVTSSSFEIRAQEWTYLTGKHFDESVSYVVMEAGIHRLSDGTTIVADNTHGVDHNFDIVNLGMEFADTPVVLAQTVTVNGGATVTTRLDNIDQDSFVVKLQEEEAADQTHNPETVSWLAFLPNQEPLGILNQESDTTGFVVDENVETVSFNVNFDAPPVFLANMQEFVGSNTATVRLAGLTNTEATIFIEEEQSRDEEVGHGNENVGFLALAEGDIVGRTIIGEAGRVPDLHRDWQTVQLSQHYLDPVILVSINSHNESDPATVRVRNVTSNSFEMHIEEWNYLDLNHAPETVSYVVFEAGIHRLRDGTIIEAQNSGVNDEWSQIDFTGDKEGITPLVFSQVISDHGPTTVTTRQHNITDTGFQIRLQEEEASETQPHLTEFVSWVAIREGAGNSGGSLYEALESVNPVNHVIDTTIPFATTFEAPPVVIANMQTTIGINTATVRQTFITPGRVDLFVEEERSLDNEVGHVGEDIGVLAFDAGIIDGFIQELFGGPPPVVGGRMGGLPLTPTFDPMQDSMMDRSSLDSQAIQNMMLAREQFNELNDSVFEQLDRSSLIHVDLDLATVVPAMLDANSLIEDSLTTVTDRDDSSSADERPSDNSQPNPFDTLNLPLQ